MSLPVVCKIPLLARRTQPKAARPSARATIGYLVYNTSRGGSWGLAGGCVGCPIDGFRVVCKIPLLARALGLKAAARPSARATIGYLVYNTGDNCQQNSQHTKNQANQNKITAVVYV